ncbi:hypothetical protein [Embleya sp. NPDC001921]
MTAPDERPRPTVGPSGDPDRPIRITASGRAPLDVTRAELAALIADGRAYMVRTHCLHFSSLPLVLTDERP